jgi:hypothetical protein
MAMPPRMGLLHFWEMVFYNDVAPNSAWGKSEIFRRAAKGVSLSCQFVQFVPKIFASLRLCVKNNCDKNQSVEILPQPDAAHGK